VAGGGGGGGVKEYLVGRNKRERILLARGGSDHLSGIKGRGGGGGLREVN